MQKRILILGASKIQLPIILRAKELGYFTIVSDYNPSAPGFKHADKKLLISTNDTLMLLKAAEDFKIDGILTTSDYPIRTVARIAESLKLHGPSTFTAEISTNKFLQREILKKAGLRVPNYILLDDSNRVNIPFSFPVIVKPVDSSASRGVSKVDRLSEIKYAITYAKENSLSGQVIVEEFIIGPEFSIETLTQNTSYIVAITEKGTSGDEGKFFVEEQHVIPAALNDADENLIKTIVIKAIDAVGLNNAPSHIEVILSAEGPVIIEIAARLGGDFITSDLVPLSTGVDMLENQIKISLGQPINIQEVCHSHAGIRFLTPENYHLASEKINLLRNDNRLIKWEQLPFKREIYKPLRNSLDRLGYWIVKADTRDSLLNAIDY